MFPHLENMERLKLDVPRLILKEHHHLHQVRDLRHKPDHDLDIAPVQKDLPQELMKKAHASALGSKTYLITQNLMMKTGTQVLLLIIMHKLKLTFKDCLRVT